MRKLLILGLTLFVGLGFAQTDNPDASLVEGLAGDENFSTLISLLEQAGLSETLSGAGPFTVFAPVNTAFEELDPAVLEQLQNDAALLEQVLLTHVVEGTYGLNDLQDLEEGEVVSLQGEPLYFDVEAGGLTVNNADLDSANVGNNYANGVVHVVGDVVVPVSLAGQFGVGDFGDDEVEAAGTDAGDETDAAEAEDAEANTEDGVTADATLVALLEQDGRFTTLLSAVAQAGLTETLDGVGPFTLLAPTDEAFDALPQAELDALLNDKAALERVLSYHVIEGDVMSDTLEAGEVTTLEGSALNVSTDDGVQFNEASVNEADLEASNGVIHVIDQVLMPEDMND